MVSLSEELKHLEQLQVPVQVMSGDYTAGDNDI